MSKSVNIAAAMMGALENVSNLDTSAEEQIEYVDIGLLDADPNNFYELSDIKELASNIQVCGLMQPLRVTAVDGGRFRIGSGHRRHAALTLLVKEGHSSFRNVAIIRERQDISTAFQELRLIFANSDNRELTDAEIAKQAERVEFLLYQLKEEGMEFPGRMRDQVAAACKVSASKLARLRVIREGLISEYADLFAQDKLPEQTAYALARFPQEFQQRLEKAFSEVPAGHAIERLLKRYTEDGWRWEPSMSCPDGKPCKRGDTFLRHDAGCCGYEECGGNACCLKCRHGTAEYGACDKACSRLKEVKKEKRDEAAERAEAQKKKQQTKLQKEIRACACRLMVAIDAAGIKESERLEFRSGWSQYTAADVRAFAAGDFGDRHFYGNDLDPAGYSNVGALAKKLKCSADYLLGLTDDLGNALPEEAPAEPVHQEAVDKLDKAPDEEHPNEDSALYGEDDEPETADDEDDIADGDQFVQTIRWESSGLTPPIGEIIVTCNQTNDGAVYRPAVWDGSKFHEPGKPKKELTGLMYRKWIRLPKDESQAAVLGEEIWHRGTEPPQSPCWVVALLSLNGYSLTRQVLYCFSGNYYFDRNFERRADIEPVAWMELPEMPDWAEAKGDAEDYE